MARKKVKPIKKKSATIQQKDETPELKRLRSIFNLMNELGVSELELQKGSEKIRACTGSVGVRVISEAPSHQVQQNTQQTPVQQSQVPQKAPAASKNIKEVCSPLVGTYYSSPSPQSEVYVKEGQKVSKGDILCIVEAMKLMNEIESEFSGKIVSICVENGQPVEYGEPLFLIDVGT